MKYLTTTTLDKEEPNSLEITSGGTSLIGYHSQGVSNLNCKQIFSGFK